MIFRITGADNKTGADRTISVSADSERNALAIAKGHGIHPFEAERDKAAEILEAHRAKAAEEENRLRREEADRERRIRQFVDEVKAKMRARLAAGRAVFLYETTYLPVDSVLLEKELNIGFDIPELRVLGIEGWEVMQVIPRTVGVGLQNTSIGSTMGTTWGGGSGGNVVGVHVILKKSIGLDDLSEEPDDEVGVYIRSNAESFKTA